MLISAGSAGAYESRRPAEGWTKSDFPRPPVAEREKYVETSGSRIEEVVRLPDGRLIFAASSKENSIYFFEAAEDEETGRPVGYSSPFRVIE
jgi:hypothetical protein